MLNVRVHAAIIQFGHVCCSDYTMLINTYATGVSVLLIYYYNGNIVSVLLLLRVVTEQLKTYSLLQYF